MTSVSTARQRHLLRQLVQRIQFRDVRATCWLRLKSATRLVGKEKQALKSHAARATSGRWQTGCHGHSARTRCGLCPCVSTALHSRPGGPFWKRPRL